MTFIPTSASLKNDFGIYFTESVISSLAESTKKIKIFERKRLDVILQENSLSLSGLIDEKQALKLGELAPIDFIFSGTFTKLKNSIEINGRLIDVVTGEILTSYSGSIKKTADLEDLFKEEIHINSTKVDPCKQKQDEIEYLLKDLSNEDKIQYLVDRAIKIPFDNTCGKIHYNVMFDFKKYNITNPAYKSFLISTLDNIEFPDNDSRAAEILRYLSRDDYIDDDEWQHGLNVLQKVGNYHLSSYLQILLLRKDNSKDPETAYKRIDQFVKLVNQKKVGLPVPIDFNMAFFELLDAFNHLYSKENILLMYCYGEYKDDVVLDDKEVVKLFGLLETMYLRDEQIENKVKILNGMIEFIKKNQMSEKLADELYSFVKNFEITSYKNDHPEEIKKAPPQHFEIFVKGINEKFCEALALADIKSQIEERVDFCLENNIPCPEVIPTLEECVRDINSADSFKETRAFEILEKMGQNARAAEQVISTVLDTDDLVNKSQTSTNQRHAANILGNIKTENPKSLKLLVDALGSLNYMVPDAAQQALVKIGKPAVPYLIEALNSKFGGVLYKAVTTLGMIGKDANQAIKPLEKIYQETNNSAVYRAIEIALKLIK
jgi:TolB-like protein